MFLTSAPRVAFVSLAVAAVVLTGCSKGGSTAPPKVTPSVTSSAVAAPTMTAPTATATAQAAPQASVTAVSGLKATDKKVIARYGQKDADLAMATAQMIGYKISAPDLLTGKIKGNDVLAPLGDVIDARLLKILQEDPKRRNSLVMGNLPYTVLSSGAPTISVGQPSDNLLDGVPVVGVRVDVDQPETTKEKGAWIHHWPILVLLERQSDTSEGTWRLRAFRNYGDSVKPVL